MSTNSERYTGTCTVCDERFEYSDEDEYESAVARHIVDEHRDEPLDKPLVYRDTE